MPALSLSPSLYLRFPQNIFKQAHSGKLQSHPLAGDPGGSYIGCFRDVAGNRDLDLLSWVGEQTHTAACMQRCHARGFKYAGLQVNLDNMTKMEKHKTWKQMFHAGKLWKQMFHAGKYYRNVFTKTAGKSSVLFIKTMCFGSYEPLTEHQAG